LIPYLSFSLQGIPYVDPFYGIEFIFPETLIAEDGISQVIISYQKYFVFHLFYKVCNKGLENINLREIFFEEGGLLRDKTSLKKLSPEKAVYSHDDGKQGSDRLFAIKGNNHKGCVGGRLTIPVECRSVMKKITLFHGRKFFFAIKCFNTVFHYDYLTPVRLF
jgi:hypothetical protein